MNRLLQIVPMAIVLISLLGWVLKSDELQKVPVYYDQGSSYSDLKLADTVETGQNYLLRVGDYLSDSFLEDSLDWSIWEIGSKENTTLFIHSRSILRHSFGKDGKYLVRVLKDQKLCAIDTLNVIDGFNELEFLVPSRVKVDSLFKMGDLTPNAVRRNWIIESKDTSFVRVDTIIDESTIEFKFNKPGEYLVSLEVRNDRGKSLQSAPLLLEVYAEVPDVDADGDGIVDRLDAFPDDATEWLDRDSDGHGDNKDKFPTDPSEWADSDGDGVGDNSDDDIDGDGVKNADDAYPRNKRLHKRPSKNQGSTESQGSGKKDDSRTTTPFGDPSDLEGNNKITSGYNSPSKTEVEFRSGECSVVVKPLINLKIESFDYWPGPGVGGGLQFCLLRIECIDCIGDDLFRQKKFSTPHNNNRSEQKSCGEVLLAGNTYRISLSTVGDASRLGFISVPLNQRKSIVENKLEMEYEGSQTAIFELIFEN